MSRYEIREHAPSFFFVFDHLDLGGDRLFTGPFPKLRAHLYVLRKRWGS